MSKKLLAAPIAAFVLTILFAPFVAEPLSIALGGTIPDLEPYMQSMSLTAVPVWWFSGGALSCPDGVGVTFAIALLVALVAMLSLAPTSRADDGGVLGNARIKTGREAIAGSSTWNGRAAPSARGFVYGFSGGKYLFEPNRHVFLDGSTGSGKTRFCLIPTIDLLTFNEGVGGSAQHSIIVSDVKNELVELTGDELERRGYRVLLLDTEKPMRGHRYNPLALVLDYARQDLEQEAEQAADSIASVIVPHEEGAADRHWVDSARGLLSAIVLLVVLSDECPEEARNLATVNEVLCRGTESDGADPSAELKRAFRDLPTGHPARYRASQLLSGDSREMQSVISTLKTNMRMFSSKNVAWLVSGNDIDPREVLTEKTALFLHVLDEGSPYNAICTILLNQIYSCVRLVAGSNGGNLPRPITIVGDEWGNLPMVESLPGLLSLARSYGMFWIGAFQSIAQLNKYGERNGRQTILSNCAVKVALRLGEEEDRRYFTELVGKTTRHTLGTSRSESTSGGSSSTSYSEHADDLVHPWEWTTRSPDLNGAMVVKMAEVGVPPAHAGTFQTPLVDCTATPTKDHFGLGSREHEKAKKEGYEKRLEERASANSAATGAIWYPKWPEEPISVPEGTWDGLALD